MKQALVQLFERDLNKLKLEIDLFVNEEHLWVKSEGISNSAGNICLHILGNLKNYIGAFLGNSGFVRDRNAEFTSKGLKTELLNDIEQTKQIVLSTLNKLDESTLDLNYSENVLGYEMKTGFFLIHLHGHLNYHLGQINYHRRILCYK